MSSMICRRLRRTVARAGSHGPPPGKPTGWGEAPLPTPADGARPRPTRADGLTDVDREHTVPGSAVSYRSTTIGWTRTPSPKTSLTMAPLTKAPRATLWPTAWLP
jgi:hypothetical protein